MPATVAMKSIPALPAGYAPAKAGVRPRRFIAARTESFAAVSWMLAIGVAFLSTGLAGMGRSVMDSARLVQAAPPPEPPVVVEDITLADLPGEPAPEPVEEPPPDDSPPELDVVMEEEIVPVPEAVPLEEVVPMLEPPPPPRTPPPAVRPREPRPQTQPRPSAPRPAAAANTAPGGQGSGGSGGAGPGKGGGGRGKFPHPPYPASAKAKGISGTVTLSIGVAPTGDVTSVSVAGSSGSSELDSHAVSWVQRRWKWPAGGARHFRMPVTFRLR